MKIFQQHIKMKSLQRHIEEKLVINKNFSRGYDWDDDIDYFFIVIFNSRKEFFIDL